MPLTTTTTKHHTTQKLTNPTTKITMFFYTKGKKKKIQQKIRLLRAVAAADFGLSIIMIIETLKRTPPIINLPKPPP